MKKRLGTILNFVLIFGTLAIVLFIGVRGDELPQAMAALKSIGFKWVALCVSAYLLFTASDALSLWYFLRRQGCKVPFAYMLFVANAGLYYSNITPGASGGQPMQIYYLHKKGVPIGLASSALMVRFFSFQAMLSVIATVLWITHGAFIAHQVGNYMWILIVGYVYNAVLVTFLLLVAFKKGIVRFFIRIFVSVGTKLHIVKDPAASTAKWEDALTTFNDSITMMMKNPGELTIQLIVGGAQLLFQMFILYFIYLALGLREATCGQVIALDVMEYISAAYMPTPGASGAQEVTFTLYFGSIFPEGIRLAALLLWRFFTYYLSLLIGALITVGYGWRIGKDEKAKINRVQ